jgi:hypothetical protein
MFNRRPGPAISAVILGLLLGGPATPDHAPADHSGHAGHAMTQEQLAMLRKVPLYRGSPISRSMKKSCMTPDTGLSQRPVGRYTTRPGLGHGYAGDGNDRLAATLGGDPCTRPRSVRMSMMDSAHVQAAVDKLEAAGATTIIVLEETGTSSLVRQWHYMFGLTDNSGYLEVPRVRTRAKVIMAKSPTRSPIIGRILGENLKSASKDPANEVALLVMHGPERKEENDEELRNLARLAARGRHGYFGVLRFAG